VTDSRGHDSGHPLGGLSWGELLAALVEAHGTLTAVAWKLVEYAEGDDVASVERALRRLRTRGQRDGGRWGHRLLRVFGVPAPIEARLRWMGLYHSPFNDLPVALCLDQLRLWDRPPIAISRARVWLHLGHASCALRTRRFDDAAVHAARATRALAATSRDRDHDSARIELVLIDAYLASRRAPDAVAALLDRAAALAAAAALSPEDRACFEARLVDHRAYQRNHAGDHAAAAALYDALPAGVHPFASYRREAGRAYGAFQLGRTADALELVQRAIDHAGDGGYTRLRAMGLLLLARIQGPGGADATARARAIAERLGDDELLARVARREAG
jgi:hypothetical protein